MKQKILYALFLTFSAQWPAQILSAQETIRQDSCDISGYKKQIDSLSAYYQSNGFALIRETSMKMESQYEMSIILPLNKGEWYSFVYIGDPDARLYELRLYDFTEKIVVYKKNQWGDTDGNIINFTYEPIASEYHHVKFVQVHKKKRTLCGYVMLFKRVKNKD